MVVFKKNSIDNSDSLAHHGILGMKWGVRRFQNEDGSLTLLGRERYGVGSQIGNSNKNRQQLSNNKKKKSLSEDQKEMLEKIGKAAMITAGAALVGAMAYSAIRSGELDELIDAGKKAIGKNLGSSIPQEFRDKAKEYGYKINEKLTEKSEDAINKVAAGTNPSGNMHNCIGTAGTMALRRMGLDVTANNTQKAFKISELENVFKGFQTDYLLSEPKSSKDAIDKCLSAITNNKEKYPEGSFGILYANNRNRNKSGHAIFWEVLNGNVVLSEPQGINRQDGNSIVHEVGRNYASVQEFFDIAGKALNKDSFFFGRIDNCEVDFSQINRIAHS